LLKLFNNLHQRKLNACVTVFHNRKEMPLNLSPKHLQLEREDTASRTQVNLRAVCWKDRGEVYVLSNMPIQSLEGNFKEAGKTVKPVAIKDYTHVLN
jgi:hypothetical protein